MQGRSSLFGIGRLSRFSLRKSRARPGLRPDAVDRSPFGRAIFEFAHRCAGVGGRLMFRLTVASFFLTLILAKAAWAEPSPRTIDQFQHTRWTPREGAPWGVNEITQSPDGFIWLASPEGLIRFDGVKFDTFTPPGYDPATAPSLLSVLATRSGEVWVGLSAFGGVAAFRDGRMVSMAMPDPDYLVTHMVQDHDGDIWVAAGSDESALRRYRNGRWEVIAPEWNISGGNSVGEVIADMIVGKDGALWVAIRGKVLVLPRGARRFVETGAQTDGGVGLAIDSGGRVWIADARSVRRLPDFLHGETAAIKQPDYALDGTRRPRIRFAPDGSLWGSSFSDWLFRIRNPDKDGEISRYRSAGG